MNLVWFTVDGKAVQEGNIAFGKGHSYHREGSRLDQWRRDIGWTCKEAMKGTPMWGEPLELSLYFTYRPRKKVDSEAWKVTGPDLDKLTRAVLDALTGVLYNDDRQVVKIEAFKQYGQWASKSEGGPEEASLGVTATKLEMR